MINSKKKEIIAIIIVLIIQTMVYVFWGLNKEYIHMDEVYSFGLVNYDKVEIQDNWDFYNTWHTNEYYMDYLTVNEDEKSDFSSVYKNQKNDVHPPLYYLLLRISMGVSINEYSTIPGIALNIVIHLAITVLMYLILKKILYSYSSNIEKSLLISLVAAITLSTISSVIYIRMYSLSTLNILIITYLHILLSEKEKYNIKILGSIAVAALIGSLTHYYYLFFLGALFLIFIVKLIKNKEYSNLWKYVVSLIIAGVSSLIIFPYSINHLFFGYRGQGAISKILDYENLFKSIDKYILKLNTYTFSNLLIILLLVLFGLAFFNLGRKSIVINKNVEKKKFKFSNKYIALILIPTIVYFIFISISSPWVELRYIMPICDLIFILILISIMHNIKTLVSEKKQNVILGSILILIVINPVISKLLPEQVYLDKKEIVDILENDLNLPTVYMLDSSNNRFLDDILLFSKLDNSYVAKDLEITEENILNILEGKDLSKGIVVFINENQDNDKIVDVIKNATNLNEVSYLKRLNACDVYYINNR